MKTLIIIPAYNEENNIIGLLETLKNRYDEYDFLVINDCSTDATKVLLKQFKAAFLDLPVNLGIGGGVQSGYIYALENGYDIAVQMDGDGQHLPEYLETIINPIKAGEANFVVGSRFIENEGFQSSKLRRLGINMLSSVLKIVTGTKVLDVTSGFRAVDRNGIELFSRDYAQDYPEPEALAVALRNGLKVKEVPVQMKARDAGTSSISGFKNIYYMVKVTLALLLTRISY